MDKKKNIWTKADSWLMGVHDKLASKYLTTYGLERSRLEKQLYQGSAGLSLICAFFTPNIFMIGFAMFSGVKSIKPKQRPGYIAILPSHLKDDRPYQYDARIFKGAFGSALAAGGLVGIIDGCIEKDMQRINSSLEYFSSGIAILGETAADYISMGKYAAIKKQAEI